MERAASSLGRFLREDDDDAPVPAFPVTSQLRTDRSRYRIRASYLGDALADVPMTVLVVLECLTPTVPTDSELAERFSLTPRQAETARLLADGRSNRDIAEALCVSEHTARHHVEQVLLKLNVDNRSAVLPQLLQS